MRLFPSKEPKSTVKFAAFMQFQRDRDDEVVVRWSDKGAKAEGVDEGGNSKIAGFSLSTSYKARISEVLPSLHYKRVSYFAVRS